MAENGAVMFTRYVLDKLSVGERAAVLLVVLAPGNLMVRIGIGNHAVHIENYSFEHKEAFEIYRLMTNLKPKVVFKIT